MVVVFITIHHLRMDIFLMNTVAIIPCRRVQNMVEANKTVLFQPTLD